MSTNGVIGRATGGEGEFSGVFNRWDSYPRWMGPHLWQLLHDTYKGNLSQMLKAVIDKSRAERITHENISGCIAWCWIFDESNRRLFVRDHRHDADVAIVDLFAPEPDWDVMQCGENLERCSHYAYVHFPELADSKSGQLGTHTYLGEKEFSFHDVAAVIVKGKRYECTGSGMLTNGQWFSSLVAKNGRKLDLAVANVNRGDYRPCPGVTWVFPPTKDNPNETLADASESRSW